MNEDTNKEYHVVEHDAIENNPIAKIFDRLCNDNSTKNDIQPRTSMDDNVNINNSYFNDTGEKKNDTDENKKENLNIKNNSCNENELDDDKMNSPNSSDCLYSSIDSFSNMTTSPAEKHINNDSEDDLKKSYTLDNNINLAYVIPVLAIGMYAANYITKKR
jgi:hypothetical protein